MASRLESRVLGSPLRRSSRHAPANNKPEFGIVMLQVY